MNRFKGASALVTGASRGLGFAIARELANRGARLLICARDATALDQAAWKLHDAGAEVYAVPCDITDEHAAERLIAEAELRYGGIDILVNNAGTSARGAFLEITDDTWHSDIELKVFGAIRCTRLAVPHMKKHGGGRIINITISSAKQPGAGSMPTTISRAAGLALTKAMSKEFAADNILVNTVCIGKIKSGQHERRIAKTGVSADDYYSKEAKPIPLGRFGESDEAANVIVFLCSAAASYVTGTSVHLDGGMSGVL